MLMLKLSQIAKAMAIPPISMTLITVTLHPLPPRLVSIALLSHICTWQFLTSEPQVKTLMDILEDELKTGEVNSEDHYEMERATPMDEQGLSKAIEEITRLGDSLAALTLMQNKLNGILKEEEMLSEITRLGDSLAALTLMQNKLNGILKEEEKFSGEFKRPYEELPDRRDEEPAESLKKSQELGPRQLGSEQGGDKVAESPRNADGLGSGPSSGEEGGGAERPKLLEDSTGKS
jgi:hypothetical protein